MLFDPLDTFACSDYWRYQILFVFGIHTGYSEAQNMHFPQYSCFLLMVHLKKKKTKFSCRQNPEVSSQIQLLEVLSAYIIKQELCQNVTISKYYLFPNS